MNQLFFLEGRLENKNARMVRNAQERQKCGKRLGIHCDLELEPYRDTLMNRAATFCVLTIVACGLWASVGSAVELAGYDPMGGAPNPDTQGWTWNGVGNVAGGRRHSAAKRGEWISADAVHGYGADQRFF